MQKKNKLNVRIVLLFIFVLGLCYFLTLSISRVGESKVTIRVIPEDSRVLVKNQPVSSKAIYLSAGNYTFSAEKDGFENDSQNHEVKKGEATIINLLPEPTSPEAKQWLTDNPKIQLQREKMGGEKAALQGQEAIDKNPLLGALPYEDVTGPFEVDYGPSETRAGDTYLVISSLIPQGRTAAIDWLKSQGADPTDYEIRYHDFVNPLVTGGYR